MLERGHITSKGGNTYGGDSNLMKTTDRNPLTTIEYEQNNQYGNPNDPSNM